MLYICLPACNEEKGIKSLFHKIEKGLAKRKYAHSIIFYDDGSTDNTLQVVKDCSRDMNIEIIEGKINRGLGFALKVLVETVIERSNDADDIAIMLDADDTHNPEHIFRMVDMIHEGFDLIVASRFRTNSRVVGVPAYRNFLSYGASLLMRILFPIKGIKDFTSGYRAYRVDILKKAKAKYGDKLFIEEGFACMAELILKLRTLNLLAAEIPIILRYDNKISESKMNVTMNVVKTLKLIFKLRLSLTD